MSPNCVDEFSDPFARIFTWNLILFQYLKWNFNFFSVIILLFIPWTLFYKFYAQNTLKTWISLHQQLKLIWFDFLKYFSQFKESFLCQISMKFSTKLNPPTFWISERRVLSLGVFGFYTDYCSLKIIWSTQPKYAQVQSNWCFLLNLFYYEGER